MVWSFGLLGLLGQLALWKGSVMLTLLHMVSDGLLEIDFCSLVNSHSNMECAHTYTNTNLKIFCPVGQQFIEVGCAVWNGLVFYNLKILSRSRLWGYFSFLSDVRWWAFSSDGIMQMTHGRCAHGSHWDVRLRAIHKMPFRGNLDRPEWMDKCRCVTLIDTKCNENRIMQPWWRCLFFIWCLRLQNIFQTFWFTHSWWCISKCAILSCPLFYVWL